MSRPAMRVTSTTISASDPRALAAFYGRLLGRPVTASEPPRPGRPASDGWAQIRTAGEPTLNFEWEAEHRPPAWPSRPGEPQVQAHLDIAVTELDAAMAHAIEVGATLAPHQPQDDVRVLFDPAGHPFCLFLDPDAAGA